MKLAIDKMMLLKFLPAFDYTVPYGKKLWRGKNFGEFGESQQFANFFSPIFILVHVQ